MLRTMSAEFVKLFGYGGVARERVKEKGCG